MPPFLGAGFVSGGSLAKYHSPSGSTADLYNFAGLKSRCHNPLLPSWVLGVQISPFYMDSSCVGLDPTLMTSFILINTIKTSLQIRLHMEVLGVRT